MIIQIMRWSEQFNIEEVLVTSDSVGLILKEKKGHRTKWIMMNRSEYKKISTTFQNNIKNEIMDVLLDEELDFLAERQRKWYFGEQNR